MKRELLFKVKEIFNPKDSLAKWILKLAIARNDMFHLHNRLLDLDRDGDAPFQVGERSFFFPIGGITFEGSFKITIQLERG